ncbi:ribosomal protein S18 acetylase RimI-like enzyme [Kitasatospora gansuensis]|uniref:Ribosomal protein S18 acetylase RimI-like enzyme n=1 Tax=Kitasatospora gansuensis TaxID=258050 RepID=A0A7W7S7R4_9ACTN|nr:GNAT family N-acetyltransferase [Kitasatospora gansuensis]MBB4945097.1 ribosomal protein S18 acetylase RimI-like enzyme [Kitasatospora gansuensis]
MNTTQPTPGPTGHPLTVLQVSEHQWHAVQDDRVVGRADAWQRPDGRTFVSTDAWDGAVLDRLTAAAATGLPTPLYTLVDENDPDLLASWQRAGFTLHRREWQYAVPTDPNSTGLDALRPPSDLRILPAGQAAEAPLRALDRVIRAEVAAGAGWQTMPAEVIPLPDGVTVPDPSKFAVAVQAGRYVGLLRLAPVPRQPRIDLIAVRADHQRQGVARALLAQTLGSLHRSGVATATAEVSESNHAAQQLFERIGARRVGGNLELVRR